MAAAAVVVAAMVIDARAAIVADFHVSYVAIGGSSWATVTCGEQEFIVFSFI